MLFPKISVLPPIYMPIYAITSQWYLNEYANKISPGKLSTLSFQVNIKVNINFDGAMVLDSWRSYDNSL